VSKIYSECWLCYGHLVGMTRSFIDQSHDRVTSLDLCAVVLCRMECDMNASAIHAPLVSLSLLMEVETWSAASATFLSSALCPCCLTWRYSLPRRSWSK
jgi:hypothetical protein